VEKKKVSKKRFVRTGNAQKKANREQRRRLKGVQRTASLLAVAPKFDVPAFIETFERLSEASLLHIRKSKVKIRQAA